MTAIGIKNQMRYAQLMTMGLVIVTILSILRILKAGSDDDA
jgi:hypothetical protein